MGTTVSYRSRGEGSQVLDDDDPLQPACHMGRDVTTFGVINNTHINDGAGAGEDGQHSSRESPCTIITVPIGCNSSLAAWHLF